MTMAIMAANNVGAKRNDNHVATLMAVINGQYRSYQREAMACRKQWRRNQYTS